MPDRKDNGEGRLTCPFCHCYDVARLYQLEIMKLRMQIQEMSRIDKAVREASFPDR